jgi:hypothetical protein
MQQDEPEWLSFQLAAEEVERRFGLTRNGSEEAVIDAIENGKLKWKRGPDGQDGPDVLYADLQRWVNPPTIKATNRPKPKPRKRLKVKAYLTLKFSGQRVPDDYVRKVLLSEVREGGDPSLKQLDDATLKTSIDEYNAERS